MDVEKGGGGQSLSTLYDPPPKNNPPSHHFLGIGTCCLDHQDCAWQSLRFTIHDLGISRPTFCYMYM